MDRIWPIAGGLGLGGLLGWCAAYALKTIGRVLGCLLGVVFILLQVLAYYGIAEIHWSRVTELVPPEEVASGFFHGLWKILTYNLPFTAGFAAGFWRGMKT